jgi:hypothetical protein
MNFEASSQTCEEPIKPASCIRPSVRTNHYTVMFVPRYIKAVIVNQWGAPRQGALSGLPGGHVWFEKDIFNLIVLISKKRTTISVVFLLQKKTRSFITSSSNMLTAIVCGQQRFMGPRVSFC